MSTKHRWKVAAKLATGLGIAGLACSALMSAQATEQGWGWTPDEATQQRIAAGYEATPVGVDLTDKDPLQVGIGSYIVNTTGMCNHCHSSNQFYKAGFPLVPKAKASDQTGNPYFLAKPKGPYTGGTRPDGGAAFELDQSTFVAGAQNFGTVDSKNLTPSTNSKPSSFAPFKVNYAAGGMDWITFWATLHNGVDIDKLFNQCPGTGAPNGCAKAPVNAGQLQVMPWAVVRQMTDSDLNAVWQYLSAIPCNTNQTNINGPTGTNVANTYGGGVLTQTCPKTKPGTYQYYKYVNGHVVPDKSRKVQ